MAKIEVKVLPDLVLDIGKAHTADGEIRISPPPISLFDQVFQNVTIYSSHIAATLLHPQLRYAFIERFLLRHQ